MFDANDAANVLASSDSKECKDVIEGLMKSHEFKLDANEECSEKKYEVSPLTLNRFFLVVHLLFLMFSGLFIVVFEQIIPRLPVKINDGFFIV
ncbi:hypothetical protein L1887_35614 [Cichorium endivia]|nr:hypothetical protein L1887_35614 [Cichorium endivia]